jgi:hypothetical protein
MTPPARDADGRDSRLKFSQRVQEIRLISYGQEGVPALAKELGLPWQTWQNYEAGATMPGVVLLKFIEVTGVSPGWLLTGDGPKFKHNEPVRVPEMTSSLFVGEGDSRMFKLGRHSLN